MKIPYSEIKKWLCLEHKPEDVADILTSVGLEVDAIENSKAQFEGVLCVKIDSIRPHPEADKLRLVTVNDGEKLLEIVCGDPSVEVGMYTAFAPVGAKLANEYGVLKALKPATIRGFESLGMLVSEKDLLISDHDESVMIIENKAWLGQKLDELVIDPVFEISLTPNLGHCYSVLGVARELAAKCNVALSQHPLKTVSAKKELLNGDDLKLVIADTNACPRYFAKVMSNIQTLETPKDLKTVLSKAGFQSVNLVVDALNYITFLLGQPMHAFDRDKIQSQCIRVQPAQQPITMLCLDDQERSVPEGTLMIYDDTTPIAIAGVIGSKDSAVSETTKHILIESAEFNPSVVRASMKRVQLRTEAGAHFEKGIDGAKVHHALEYAVKFISDLSAAQALDGVIFHENKPVEERQILCLYEYVEKVLGYAFRPEEITSLLKRLNISVTQENEATFAARVPTYRNDLVHPIDIIEEIIKVYGFENLPEAKMIGHNSTLSHHPLYLMEESIRSHLLSEGMTECISCNLIGPDDIPFCTHKELSDEHLIRVKHAKSVEQSILRPNFVPNFLQMVAHNAKYQQHTVRAFDVGRIHYKDGEKHIEKDCAAICLSGKKQPNHFSFKNRDVDFYDIKGHLENLFSHLKLKSVEYKPSNITLFHPSAQCEIFIGRHCIGVAGQLHPKMVDEFGIKASIFLAELDIALLYKMQPKKLHMKQLPLYPSSERDVTVPATDSVVIGDLVSTAKKAGGKLLENVEVTSVYLAKGNTNSSKNITLRLTYRSTEKTLSNEEVEKQHASVVSAIEKSL